MEEQAWGIKNMGGQGVREEEEAPGGLRRQDSVVWSAAGGDGTVDRTADQCQVHRRRVEGRAQSRGRW